MSTKPRTPEHFPRMKHRAAKRVVYLDILPDLSGFIEAANRAAGSLAALPHGWRVEQFLIDAPPYWETPTQPTTQAAPNFIHSRRDVMSLMPDDEMPPVIHINRPGATKVIHFEDLGERWCFKCRKRRNFAYTVTAEIEPSYYGPNPDVKCEICGTSDGDLFPSREREWEC